MSRKTAVSRNRRSVQKIARGSRKRPGSRKTDDVQKIGSRKSDSDCRKSDSDCRKRRETRRRRGRWWSYERHGGEKELGRAETAAGECGGGGGERGWRGGAAAQGICAVLSWNCAISKMGKCSLCAAFKRSSHLRDACCRCQPCSPGGPGGGACLVGAPACTPRYHRSRCVCLTAAQLFLDSTHRPHALASRHTAPDNEGACIAPVVPIRVRCVPRASSTLRTPRSRARDGCAPLRHCCRARQQLLDGSI